MKHNIVSVSGGKDSTALLLLAIERKTHNVQAVFPNRSAYRLAKRGRWRSQRQTGEVVAVVDSLISDCEQMCQEIISQHRLTGRKKQRIRAQVREMCKRLSLNEFRWRQEISR